MATVNIFAQLFGIFRQGGLVTSIKEGRSLLGFGLSALLFSIIGGALYGFAMGFGLGLETAVKDAIKVGLVISLGLLFSLPIFWVAYRLLGRDEPPSQVAAVPLTLVATVAIILMVTAPIVFLLGVLVGFSPAAIYIHIVIVDLALLVGLYLSGTLLYHSFTDHKRLIIPNVVGFLMVAVILVVLLNFLAPFLAPHLTFSVGTDRLKDGLGLGVAEKVNHALTAARAADRISYRFQTTNDNGDLVRDYTVTRVGDDYSLEIHRHAVPGETVRSQQRIWWLDDQCYNDFDRGRITQSTEAELAGFLGPALPSAAFSLPPELANARWRASASGGRYTAIGTSPTLDQATLTLEAATGRLAGLMVGSAQTGLHAETRLYDIAPATLDQAGLQASLNQAIVIGSVDRAEAALQDYVQGETFFVVRYPRTWRAGNWITAQQRVEFTADCGASQDCPALTVTVYDLAEGKGPKQYAEDLARSLDLQPPYRQIKIGTTTISNEPAGVVEYLFDRTVKGEIETAHHLEYIFEGQLSRYHLDFSAPSTQFEANRSLFEAMAGDFTYLR